VRRFQPVLEAHTVEPTLYGDLPALAAYATEHGLRFRVFTSGASLADMADDLVKAGVDQVYVSIDGPPAMHDAIRGRPGSFERAFHGIRAIKVAAQRTASCRTKVRINAVISQHNCAHLVDLVEAVRELDPLCVMFMHLNFVTAGMAEAHNRTYGHVCSATPLAVGGTDPSAVDVGVLYEQICQLKERYPAWQIKVQPSLTTEAELRTYYHQPRVLLGGGRCFMPWQTAMIIPDGSVIIRNRCYHIIFGSIFEDDLMSIWNGQPFRAFRVALRQVGVFPACARCYGAFG
jgi:MoaA/NifB/PqqE/SkfB family radical SAM enzyme